ncbi:hypothetical protein [Lactobacillus porci]|uniref:Uncharacterized protein n=1 Tax=Lactobacillus porci TaxID=2012477 RepID=A0A6A8MEL8_9LACO|nr:hypothetical protein [Lactobacillus porci]MST87229.1 hypothetical protein [Lactobacillus porci]
MNDHKRVPSLKELRGKDYVPFSDKRWRETDPKEVLAGLVFDHSHVTEEAKRKHDELMKRAAEIRKAQRKKTERERKSD